jgi:DNA-binding LacI/PurR family transcriptional regulator
MMILGSDEPIKIKKMKKYKQTTVKDLAKLTGFSTATISRAFTPGASIALSTKEKILDAASQLGYKSSGFGRILLNETNKTVGIIMGDLTNPIRSTIIDELIDRLQNLGCLTLLFKGGNQQNLQRLIPKVLDYRLRVLVVTGFMPRQSSITNCHEAGVPLIILNRGQIKGTSANIVTCDHYEGGKQAAKALIEVAKCKRIGMVCGTPETGANEARIEGFLNGLNSYGAKLWVAEEGDFSYKSGVTAAYRIFKRSNPPDGLFCLNDEIALGVMDVARYDFNLKIPYDLSVIGYDDIEAASWPTYRLTTIKQPLEKLISEPVKIIEKLIKDPVPTYNTIIPVEVVYRDSLC